MLILFIIYLLFDVLIDNDISIAWDLLFKNLQKKIIDELVKDKNYKLGLL